MKYSTYAAICTWLFSRLGCNQTLDTSPPQRQTKVLFVAEHSLCSTKEQERLYPTSVAHSIHLSGPHQPTFSNEFFEKTTTSLCTQHHEEKEHRYRDGCFSGVYLQQDPVPMRRGNVPCSLMRIGHMGEADILRLSSQGNQVSD